MTDGNPISSPGRLTQILDLQQAAQFLGRPITTLRYWGRCPPPGFPEILRSGNRRYIRAAELERWALGSAAPAIEAQGHTVAPPSLPAKRGRGRPRKHPLPKTGGEA